MKREQFNKKVEEAKNLAKNLKEDFVQGYNEEAKKMSPVQRKILTWSAAGLGAILLLAFFTGGDKKEESVVHSKEMSAKTEEADSKKDKNLPFNGKMFSLDEIYEGAKILEAPWFGDCKKGAKFRTNDTFYEVVRKGCNINLGNLKKRIKFEEENYDLFLVSGAFLAHEMNKRGMSMKAIMIHTAPQIDFSFLTYEMFDASVALLEASYLEFDGDEDIVFWMERIEHKVKK